MSEQEQARIARAAAAVLVAVAVLSPVLWLMAAAASRSTPAFVDAVAGMAQAPWHAHDPAAAFGPGLGERMPAARGFWTAVGMVVVLVAAGVAAIAMRVDRWRGRRRMGLRSYDPRSWVTPRTFARPRDLRHLRRVGDADAWTTLRLDGRMLATGPETHVLTIAPTRSGKTTGPVTTWTVEHQGPVIVTSTKADIVALTAGARLEQGPVWIFAPAVPDEALPMPGCGWSPLDGCEVWEHAQMTARWLAANTIGGNDVQESDGARFYNREAGRVLASLLHAAALDGARMHDVNAWLRAEDQHPLAVLRRHQATAAARALDAFFKTDAKPRTLTIATAGQLIDAYEYESVQATDRTDFDPRALLEGGTLYLVAPEARQDLVQPLFSALLGAIFRAAEMRALEHGPLEPQLRVILDEARRLGAIDDLPSLLSVSGGWGVRIATVWQNLDQITARYGRETDEILGNSLAKLILGPIQDRATREYLVDLLDDELVDDKTYDVDGFGGRVARSMARRQRDKASAQTLQQLARGEALLIHGRDLPAKGRVLAFWENRPLKRQVEAGQQRLKAAAAQRLERASTPPAQAERRVLDASTAHQVIAVERQRCGLTIDALAQATGMDAALVADLESGTVAVSPTELAVLLQPCGLVVEQSPAGRLAVIPARL